MRPPHQFLADAGDALARTAELVGRWKGIDAAAHRVSVGTDGSTPYVSLCLEAQALGGAFWLWMLEVRCGPEGWAVRDTRQGLDESGDEQVMEMSGYQGTAIEELVEQIGVTVTHIVRNISNGWWLRVRPRIGRERECA